MTSPDLERIALGLVADGKGILAADETVPTLTRRFDALRIKSTEQSRRDYREMLFAAPCTAESISGAIMYDETIRQKSSPAARHLPRFLRVGAFFPASRSTWAPNLLPAHLTSESLRVSTVCAIAFRNTAPWGPASRSGGRSFT